MRILHTADLHLGRQFNGIALEADQEAILEQIVQAVVAHRVDVLVIAGDIFDRAAPPSTAVRQFNGFLTRIAEESSAAVVMIAGNHDSGDRIESMSILTDRRRALIRGALCAEELPLILTDAAGPVAFSALPFGYEYAARACFDDESIQNPEDVLAAQVAAARRHLPPDARWVIVAHAFVAGAENSDAERPLARVGGIETVRPEIFAGAQYVALGHLHRPQAVGFSHVCYSGAPLAFGFDEAEAAKSMNLVEMDAEGGVQIEVLPFEPLRRVRVLRGTHAELLRAPPSEDLIKAVLTDPVPVIDAMKRLREVFPNACDLTYARDAAAPEVKSALTRGRQVTDPLTVVGDFLEGVRGEGMRPEELTLVARSLHALARDDAGEAA